MKTQSMEFGIEMSKKIVWKHMKESKPITTQDLIMFLAAAFEAGQNKAQETTSAELEAFFATVR